MVPRPLQPIWPPRGPLRRSEMGPASLPERTGSLLLLPIFLLGSCLFALWLWEGSPAFLISRSGGVSGEGANPEWWETEVSSLLSSPSAQAGSLSHPPTMPAVSLLDLSGRPVPVGSLVGHPLLLVNLLATWCTPCLREIPSLVALSRRTGGLVAVVGIVEGAEDRTVLVGIKKRYGKRFPLRLDPAMRFSAGLGVHGLPESFLVDSRGKVVSRVEGRVDWTDPRVVRYLKSFLAKKAGI